MGVVAERRPVVVMYAGRKVEEASAAHLFDNPGHPYTKGLLGSIPHLDTRRAATETDTIERDQGHGAFAVQPASGCSFAPRCGFATDHCRNEAAVLTQYRPGHWIACWHADRLLGGAA